MITKTETLGVSKRLKSIGYRPSKWPQIKLIWLHKRNKAKKKKKLE
jgi:hypothetical protein